MTNEEKLRALLAEALKRLPVGCTCDSRFCSDFGLTELKQRIDAALAEPVEDGFGCCGGSDETPPEHTQDCSVHPPQCLRCKKQQSVCIAGNGEAYEARCAECLLRERDEARAEVERLQGVVDAAALCVSEMLAKFPDKERAAYQRGAEAMRKAAIRAVSYDEYADLIRDLPIPEDKP